MQTPWRIELLGWLRAETDEHTVTRFATHKTAALLARLALWPRRAHSREELVELLWPEVEFDAARARLRQALTSLRHQLEPPGVEVGSVLIADRTHIRLNPEAISTDVADFEAAMRLGQLAQAIALYKGELLPGFYEEWVLTERERLQARFEEITLAQSSERVLVPEPLLGTVSVAPIQPPLPVRLPSQFTRFFGRVEEQARLAALLSEHRLVTLTGPGGSGKTRLAIEVARQQAGSYQVLSAGLADLVEGTHLAEAIVEQLRLPRDDTRTALDRLVEALSAQPILLLLDNLEHLVAYAAPLVQGLLARVPSLRLLVTSRRRLNIAGERAFPVPALPLPLEGSTPEELAALASVQLFVDRAQTVRPDFQLTPRNAAELALLCQKLEGSPLALELAAAQVATLTLKQMHTRLEQRFEFLATRRAQKDERHRSLWATIAWSVDLLPQKRQELWLALSVFRGGFTVESVAGVLNERIALDALTQLRECSLVVTEERGVSVRFRMLESLREFAQIRITGSHWETLRARHLLWYADWSEELRPKFAGVHQENTLEQIAAEEENIWEALRWSLEPRGDAPAGLRLIANLGKYWMLRGNYSIVYTHMERFVTHPANQEPSRWRIRALMELAHLVKIWQKDYALAASYYERVVVEARASNTWWAVASALHMLGTIAWDQGDKQIALQHMEEALALSEQNNHTQGIATIQASLGIFAGESGDYPRARVALEKVVETQYQLGYLSGVAHFRRVLAKICLRLEDAASAQAYFLESLESYCALGDTRGLAKLLCDIALELPLSGQALHLLGAAQTLQARVGAALEVKPDDPHLAPYRVALGEVGFASAWTEGTTLSQSMILDEARDALKQLGRSGLT